MAGNFISLISIISFLFLVHSLLAATLAAALYSAGVVGNFGAGLLQFVTNNWIFTWRNHASTVLAQIGIGLAFTVIWFLIFKFVIEKWDIPTPGRGLMEVKLFKKKDYEDKVSSRNSAKLTLQDQAAIFLEALGGSENIAGVTNCATRLRVTVKDISKVEDPPSFTAGGAHGIIKDKELVQIIVGLSVSQVRTKFEELL